MVATQFNPRKIEAKIIYPGECIEQGWFVVSCGEGEDVILHDGTENPQRFPGCGICIRSIE